MAAHKFGSTGDAYDATQCSDEIVRGDTLLIEEEGVVGLAWTWPVAVTEASGNLHYVAPGYPVVDIIRDAGWTDEQIKEAVALAVEKEFELAEWAKAYA